MANGEVLWKRPTPVLPESVQLLFIVRHHRRAFLSSNGFIRVNPGKHNHLPDVHAAAMRQPCAAMQVCCASKEAWTSCQPSCTLAEKRGASPV